MSTEAKSGTLTWLVRESCIMISKDLRFTHMTQLGTRDVTAVLLEHEDKGINCAVVISNQVVSLSTKVKNWRVSNNITMSDHRMMTSKTSYLKRGTRGKRIGLNTETTLAGPWSSLKVTYPPERSWKLR